MNVSCWIYPAVVCISPSIGTSQADPKQSFTCRSASSNLDDPRRSRRVTGRLSHAARRHLEVATRLYYFAP